MDHDNIRRALEAEDEENSSLEEELGSSMTDKGGLEGRDASAGFNDFLDRYEETVKQLGHARKRYERDKRRNLSSEELVELSILALEALKTRTRDLESNRSTEYEMVIEEGLEEMKDLQEEYKKFHEEQQRTVDRLKSQREELRTELEDSTSRRIRDIRDFKSYLTSSARDRFLAGLGFIGGGLYSAQVYPFEEGIIDFYTSASSAYASDPEMMVLTLGLPAAGLYSFKKAYDAFSDYRELDHKEDRLRSRDFDDFNED